MGKPDKSKPFLGEGLIVKSAILFLPGPYLVFGWPEPMGFLPEAQQPVELPVFALVEIASGKFPKTRLESSLFRCVRFQAPGGHRILIVGTLNYLDDFKLDQDILPEVLLFFLWEVQIGPNERQQGLASVYNLRLPQRNCKLLTR